MKGLVEGSFHEVYNGGECYCDLVQGWIVKTGMRYAEYHPSHEKYQDCKSDEIAMDPYTKVLFKDPIIMNVDHDGMNATVERIPGGAYTQYKESFVVRMWFGLGITPTAKSFGNLNAAENYILEEFSTPLAWRRLMQK